MSEIWGNLPKATDYMEECLDCKQLETELDNYKRLADGHAETMAALVTAIESSAKYKQIAAKMAEALEHYAKGAPFIGFDRGEIAAKALSEYREAVK